MSNSGFANSAASGRTGLLRSTFFLSAAGALLSCLACSNESGDDGIANYYLSGRVLDGGTLAPIPNAELSLAVGPSTHVARSDADGSFSVGPITPESDYRIGATLEGFDAFAFYGSRLPDLDDEKDTDRALVGDVLLYRTGSSSPQFTISASSRDARLPLDASSSEVRFMPVRLGVDPAVGAARAYVRGRRRYRSGWRQRGPGADVSTQSRHQ